MSSAHDETISGGELIPARYVDSAEYDLVLNEYIFIEKLGRAKRQNLVKRFNAIRLPVQVWFAGIILISFCVIGYFTQFEHAGFITLLGILGVFLFCVYTSVGTGRGVPTNLCITPFGIQFRWSKRKVYSSPVFGWDLIVGASLFQMPVFRDSGASEGRFLRLLLDRTKLTGEQRWFLWTSNARLRHNTGIDEDESQLYNRVVFEIPLDALTRSSDQKLLIELINQRLDPGLVGDSLKQEIEAVPSFTKLWLDEAQSFRRKSIEPLAVETQLQGGKYYVTERIASGGQATVYRAIDTSYDNRVVVLKELVLPVSAGSEVRQRSFDNVKNEAMLLASLNHPGIIALYDNFIEDHRAYLVIENVEGITLRDQVHDSGPLSEDVVRSIILQLCDILGYLHGLTPPVVHRDFTPDNLMITVDGKVKLLDFNVALQSESNATKTVVGKHNYIAPEQFRGKPCPQSDLYSLGATIFYLMTGKDPVSLKASSLKEAGLENSSLDEIVMKLTATDTTNRYQSVGELLVAIG